MLIPAPQVPSKLGLTVALTDTFIKNIKPTDSATGDRHADGLGLYLHVKSVGTSAGKYWRMNYRFNGKQKTIAFGVYPAVSLAKARQRRDKARELLADGIDPSSAKKEDKQARFAELTNTFETVAREFHTTKANSWSISYSAKWLRGLEKDVFPFVGRMTLPSITAPVLLEVLRRIEKRGLTDTPGTVLQNCGQVFLYGIQTGRCERNTAADLRGALTNTPVKSLAAILEPHQVGELMRAIYGYKGQPATRAALGLSALLFQRPSNIRQMEWAWINFDAAMLTIPSQDMKRTVQQKLNGRPHLVPLTGQALAFLIDMRPLTGHGRYVFPSLLTGERPMSENTVNTALRRMGYSKDEMTAHGFRAMARTVMMERLTGIHADVIEAQLAHGKSGPLGAAYDRAEYMDQRRAMMQTWANYLDKLRIGADVTQLRPAA
jgi:integrase